MTARSKRNNFLLGLAPQTALGAVASSGAARTFACESIMEDPQRQEIFPQGSTGSLMKKDTFRHTTMAPIIAATFMGAREALGPLLEMMTFGKPTVGAGQFTEAGDANNNLSTWTFAGVRPGFNTAYTSAGCILYAKFLTNVLYVYSDSARTALVAQGNATAGTITLAAMNSSGLTGTVACTSATPADIATITVTVNTISLVFATTPQVYWTCFVDDGKKLRTVYDCVMKSIKFSSQDKGPLQIEVVLWGMNRSAVGATALTALPFGNTIYAHNGDLVMRNDVGGTPVTQEPTKVSLSFDRDCTAIMGTASHPQDIYSKLIDAKIEATFEPTSEVDTVLDLIDTFDEIDLKFTNGSKLFSMYATKAIMRNPKHPEFASDDPQPVDIEWQLVEETATTPGAFLTITYQP